MAVSVSIESVSPASGKISAKPGKSKLTFTFKVVADGIIRAWRARFNPSDRNHGQLIAKRGMVCGSGDVCGPDSFSLAAASPLEAEGEVNEPDIDSNPDGEYPVEVFAMEEGAWN